MSLKNWEKRVLAVPGAPERVDEVEDELRLAAGLTRLREEAGLSQRQVADRIGVSQPRVAAIEKSKNVTIDVLADYVSAIGGHLEMVVVKGGRKIPLLSASKGSQVGVTHKKGLSKAATKKAGARRRVG